MLKNIVLNLFLITCLTLASAHVDAKDFVVVVDAGHGGKDAGALGQRTNEKAINLAIAKKLKSLIDKNMKDAKVEMTRSTDVFVPLQGRANFANSKHADIFISIHANSIDKKNPMASKINGAAVYTLGLKRSDTNLEVAMRENEVMKLEADYSTTYQGFDPSSAESYIAFEMMQHSNLDQSIALAEAVQNQLVRTAGRKNNGVRQAPFWVLVRTSMPAILVELDFICNPTMEKFMASDNGQDKLALAIYNGIAKYRKTAPIVKNKVEPTITQVKEAAKKTKDEDNSTDIKIKKPQKPKANRGRQPKDTSDNEQITATDVPRNSATGPSTSQGTENVEYRIQFMISNTQLDTNDRRLKGLSPVSYYTDGKILKYTYGTYATQSAANTDLKTIKQKFPDAFVVKLINGKRAK